MRGQKMSIQESQKQHREAMRMMDQALLAKMRGDARNHLKLLEQAYQLEATAASMIAGQIQLEPSRSVLHRSAASLALQCGKIREAEKLIAIALSGEPPEEIANELRDLLEEVFLERHLELKGIALGEE